MRSVDASLLINIDEDKSTQKFWFLRSLGRGYLPRILGGVPTLIESEVGPSDPDFGVSLAPRDTHEIRQNLHPLSHYDGKVTMDDMMEVLDSVNTSESTEKFLQAVDYKPPSFTFLRRQARLYIGDPRVCLHLAVIGALRGNNPSDSADIEVPGVGQLDLFLDTGVRAGWFTTMSEGGGRNLQGRLSMTRLSHLFAPAVLRFLRRNPERWQKRYHMNRLPPSMEFMGAASLNLPDEYREQHRIFAWEQQKTEDLNSGILATKFYKHCMKMQLPVGTSLPALLPGPSDDMIPSVRALFELTQDGGAEEMKGSPK